MQNVPKIVRERLKAAALAVNHPDADLLSAFAERSLPDRERTVVLEHLAGCGDCRDIVALALPATEPVQAAVTASPSRWLTWPVLRWGFVAAGVVAIASLGLLQLQRRSQLAATHLKQSAPVEIAANEPKKEVDRFVAAHADKEEKLQSPSTPAFADSVDSTNAVANEKKSPARAEASPARVLAPQAGGGVGSSRGATLGGTLPHGPLGANQWQQQNAAQNQAPASAPSSALAKQDHANDMSVNGRIPATSQTVQASGASPAVATEDASLDARQAPPPARPAGENSTYSVGKAKAPVPLASRAEAITNNQPRQDQAALRLTAQAPPGQIGGYVVDPTGAVVSNARITITPSKTGETATAVTNSQGTWLIAGLPTGNYKALAEAPGFKTSVLDFNYDANQPSTYSFTLSPGSASEMVEVSSANAQVQTEARSIGGLIANPEVSQTPVNGRNFTPLAVLSPALLPRWTISSAGSLQRSFDQGNTWHDVDVNANSASLASSEVVAKESRARQKDADKKVLKKQVGGLTFRAVAATGPDVWAGGSGGALYHSLDAGSHWTRVAPSSAGAILTGDIIAVEFSDPQHGKITTSTPEVWTTGDDGQTWQKQ